MRIKLIVEFDGTEYAGWQRPVSYTHLEIGEAAR